MKRICVTLLVLAGLIVAEEAGACSASAVCSDVSSNFVGSIDADNIVVTWNTDAELSTAVREYRLSRYNCGTPETCTTNITTIQRRGSCGTTENYQYTDTPPTPLTQWTYKLEVIRPNYTIACAIHVEVN